MAYRIEQLLDFALEFEPHPDNLTAAIYGGWNLCLPGNQPAESGPAFLRLPLKVKAPVKIAGIIPDLKLETRDSRRLYPSACRAQTWFFKRRVLRRSITVCNKKAFYRRRVYISSGHRRPHAHRATRTPCARHV